MTMWAGLLDDAAVFPPGNAPLADAVAAHLQHRKAWYADLVGPLVLPVSVLSALVSPIDATDRVPASSADGSSPSGAALPVSLTVPDGPAGLPAALAAVRGLPIHLQSVEVAVPVDMAAGEVVDRLADALGRDAQAAGRRDVDVVVEVPRDSRRDAVLAVLAGRWRAKFRTGGTRADLHPDEAELAASVAAAVQAGVPFKATAGLHHAVRNTDPQTGFEQHGFLDLLLATDALAGGGSEIDARALLGERDPAVVSARIGDLDPERIDRARAAFTSFGTCSVDEPVADLVGLGLLAPERISR